MQNIKSILEAQAAELKKSLALEIANGIDLSVEETVELATSDELYWTGTIRTGTNYPVIGIPLFQFVVPGSWNGFTYVGVDAAGNFAQAEPEDVEADASL
jgi:hypothetical protein